MAYRSSAFFRMALRIIPATLWDTLGFICSMEGSSSFKCFKAMATVESPSKGTRPVAISNIVTPRE